MPCLQIIQYINISLGKHKNKNFNKEQYSRAIWLCGCPVKKPVNCLAHVSAKTDYGTDLPEANPP